MTFGLISQQNADHIGSLFVTKYYNTLVKEGEKISGLYASNATINFKSQEQRVQDGIKSYFDEQLNVANFDFTSASLNCVPTFACGLNVSINGSVKRVINGKETITEMTQAFLLMPIRSGKLDVTYLILNDSLKLGKPKSVTKKAEPAPKRKAERMKSHKLKVPAPTAPKAAKEFSYARAAATAPQPTAPSSTQAAKAPAAASRNQKTYASSEAQKFKIKVKKCPPGATAELLHKEFATAFGPVAEVKKVTPTVAIVRFESVSTVEGIMAHGAKDRVLKLEFEGKVEVLDIWAHGPPRGRAKN